MAGEHASGDATVPEMGTLLGPPGGKAVAFLLSQFGAVIAREFGVAIAPAGLEPREFALLNVIARAEAPTQNAIGDQLGIPASSLVSVIDRLEESGLLERRTSAEDRRARTLHVTEEGRRTLIAAVRLAAELERRVCADLSPDERAQLLALLERVGEQLKVTSGVHPDLPAAFTPQGERA